MDPAGISVERTLPIDSALLGDVVLRFRRDSTAPALRWTLGDRGTAEVDTCFTSAGAGWTTRARLWNATGHAVTTATLQLYATDADEVRLTLEPVSDPAAAGPDRAGRLSELARAAVDELAEELLWHATHAGISSEG
jgi:hypothetical protein